MDFVHYQPSTGRNQAVKPSAAAAAPASIRMGSANVGRRSADEPEEADVATRPRLSPEQVWLLEQEFQSHPKPSGQTKRQLAELTNLSLPRVANWFQNRRAKAKQQRKLEEAQRAHGLSHHLQHHHHHHHHPPRCDHDVWPPSATDPVTATVTTPVPVDPTTWSTVPPLPLPPPPTTDHSAHAVVHGRHHPPVMTHPSIWPPPPPPSSPPVTDEADMVWIRCLLGLDATSLVPSAVGAEGANVVAAGGPNGVGHRPDSESAWHGPARAYAELWGGPLHVNDPPWTWGEPSSSTAVFSSSSVAAADHGTTTTTWPPPPTSVNMIDVRAPCLDHRRQASARSDLNRARASPGRPPPPPPLPPPLETSANGRASVTPSPLSSSIVTGSSSSSSSTSTTIGPVAATPSFEPGRRRHASVSIAHDADEVEREISIVTSPQTSTATARVGVTVDLAARRRRPRPASLGGAALHGPSSTDRDWSSSSSPPPPAFEGSMHVASPWSSSSSSSSSSPPPSSGRRISSSVSPAVLKSASGRIRKSRANSHQWSPFNVATFAEAAAVVGRDDTVVNATTTTTTTAAPGMTISSSVLASVAAHGPPPTPSTSSSSDHDSFRFEAGQAVVDGRLHRPPPPNEWPWLTYPHPSGLTFSPSLSFPPHLASPPVTPNGLGLYGFGQPAPDIFDRSPSAAAAAAAADDPLAVSRSVSANPDEPIFFSSRYPSAAEPIRMPPGLCAMSVSAADPDLTDYLRALDPTSSTRIDQGAMMCHPHHPHRSHLAVGQRSTSISAPTLSTRMGGHAPVRGTTTSSLQPKRYIFSNSTAADF